MNNSDNNYLAQIAAALQGVTIPGGTGVNFNSSSFPEIEVAPVGQGALQNVPAGTTNGVSLGIAPPLAQGIRIYLPSGSSITYAFATAQPTSAPAVQETASQSNNGGIMDENLSNGLQIFVTAIVGQPLYRWI